LIKELETLVFSMQDGKLKTDLENAVEGLELARQTHMGRDYYNFPLIRVAEFLDVEAFHTIPLEEWQELRGDGTIGNPGLVSNFLLEADTISPGELARRLAAEAPNSSRPRRNVAEPPSTDLQRALDQLSDGIALSEINPLHKEISAYVTKALASPIDERNTLEFWRINCQSFPTLAKVARRVLVVSATSCDVERLFSRAGLICTALRNRLAPKTIQCLTALRYRYAAEEKVVESTRSLRADGRAQRFATLTTDLIVNAGVSYISDEESDDEEL
tara:strand:+ start:384 stop:1205 length:822 start_codon:yes stop_codon:yes gene_type:complete